MRDEKVKVLKAIPPIDPKDLVRGQFHGYLDEKGVAPNSQVETFAALRLEIKNWRWDGVPFYIRAGKNLPVTCMEVIGSPSQTSQDQYDRAQHPAELYPLPCQPRDYNCHGSLGLTRNRNRTSCRQ